MVQDSALVKRNSAEYGARLKQERERVGLSQARAAELCGGGKRTFISWEKGTPLPADKLFLLWMAGFDVQYVVTGIRSDDAYFEVQGATKQIVERLRIIMEAEGLEPRDLAVELDEKWERIEKILASERRLGVDLLIKLGERFDIDGNWLLRGEGLMYHRPAELLQSIPEEEVKWISTFRRLPEPIFSNLLAIAEAWPKRSSTED